MKITDGSRTVEITMRQWDRYDGGYGTDWSTDFFEAGHLEYDEETDCYTVPDVDYCIEQAKYWEEDDETNTVWIEEEE